MKLPEAIELCRELAATESEDRYREALCVLLAVVEHAGDARSTGKRKDTPEYRAWKAMKARCYAPNREGYANYGGRGITVDPEWVASYEAFLRDVGPRPSPFHSIDRIDSDGNYEPSNVRWATNSEQSANRRVSRFLEFEGETLCVTEWARRKGITAPTLESRVRMGWSVSDALTTPVAAKFRKTG